MQPFQMGFFHLVTCIFKFFPVFSRLDNAFLFSAEYYSRVHTQLWAGYSSLVRLSPASPTVSRTETSPWALQAGDLSGPASQRGV